MIPAGALQTDSGLHTLAVSGGAGGGAIVQYANQDGQFYVPGNYPCNDASHVTGSLKDDPVRLEEPSKSYYDYRSDSRGSDAKTRAPTAQKPRGRQGMSAKEERVHQVSGKQGRRVGESKQSSHR